MKLSLILLFISFTITGQNIKGTILDIETSSPLEYVNIYFKKEKAGTVSNEKGQFNLNLPSEINPTDTLRFSIIGYKSKSYTFSKLKELSFVVYLSKNNENLDEVIINTNNLLQSKISYQKLNPLKKGLYDFGSALIGNKIYLIGGDESFIEDTARKMFNEVSDMPGATFKDFLRKINSVNPSRENFSSELQIYDIIKDTWITSDLTFRKRAYHEISSFNNELYVLGGITLSSNKQIEYLDDKIEVYNPNTSKILIDNTNPHQAINFASFAYQDNIIVMGGSIKIKINGERVYSNKSHIFNITSGYWYELPNLTERKEVNGVIIENKIYLIGGCNYRPLKDIESYNLTTGKWKNEGELFYGIEDPALAKYNNTIYIFNNSKILTYNIKTNMLDEYKIDLDLKNSQMHYYKNRLYIIGGFIEGDYTKSPSSNLFSIHIDEFSKTKIINSKKLINN